MSSTLTRIALAMAWVAFASFPKKWPVGGGGGAHVSCALLGSVPSFLKAVEDVAKGTWLA